MNTMEEIEKIYQILISNQNKISQLLYTQNNNSMIYGYLAGFDIDIKTIISLKSNFIRILYNSSNSSI